MSANEIPLFVYGTLSDAVICERFFGVGVVSIPAILQDYSIKTDGQFFFVTPDRGGKVPGKMLLLSGAQLELADLWEETPAIYTRQIARVLRGHVTAPAWVYSRDCEGAVPANANHISDLRREDVLLMVDQFLNKLGRAVI